MSGVYEDAQARLAAEVALQQRKKMEESQKKAEEAAKAAEKMKQEQEPDHII